MAPDSDILGGSQPDEEGTDLLGGRDLREDEDELGGPDPDEQGTDLLGERDLGARG
jgi:hypothetical protein